MGLHQGHDCVDNALVLLVRSKVDDEVSGRDHLLIGADLEAVVNSVVPRLVLCLD